MPAMPVARLHDHPRQVHTQKCEDEGSMYGTDTSQRPPLIERNTASLGQQSTFSPADF